MKKRIYSVIAGIGNNTANILTGLRIICGLLLFLFPAFSKQFYIIYLLGGLTDAADGAAARMLGTASGFGEKFDTAADFVFTAAVFIKVLSAVYIPVWILIWTGVVFAVKAGSAVYGFIRYRSFAAVHSAMNRLCGLILFIFPLYIAGSHGIRADTAVMVCICIIAGAAAVQECIMIVSGEQTGTKTAHKEDLS